MRRRQMKREILLKLKGNVIMKRGKKPTSMFGLVQVKWIRV
jgi:hypothetical protein